LRSIFFEAWSLRNIFAVTPDLTLVAPHHARLDLDQPQEKENELFAEIDQLHRQIENQKHLNRLIARAARASRQQAKQAQVRLDRLSFIQPDQLRVHHGLTKDYDSLCSRASALPALDPANVDVPGLEPGKRQWEVGKTGYLSWASAQLIQQAQLSGASAEETIVAASKEDMVMALSELEHGD